MLAESDPSLREKGSHVFLLGQFTLLYFRESLPTSRGEALMGRFDKVLHRVTTKTFSAVFSAENNCLILEILGLGKNSRFWQQYLVFGNFLILGTKSNIWPVSIA